MLKSGETNIQAEEQRIDVIANDMLDQIETVYYSGPGTTIQLRYDLPDMIQNISVLGDNEIVFLTLKDGIYSEKVFYSSMPVFGIFPSSYVETSQISKIVVRKNESGNIILCTPEFGCS